jgi:hypothetical protein
MITTYAGDVAAFRSYRSTMNAATSEARYQLMTIEGATHAEIHDRQTGQKVQITDMLETQVTELAPVQGRLQL